MAGTEQHLAEIFCMLLLIATLNKGSASTVREERVEEGEAFVLECPGFETFKDPGLSAGGWAMAWYKESMNDYYSEHEVAFLSNGALMTSGDLKDRATIDTTSGALKIEHTKISDSHKYTCSMSHRDTDDFYEAEIELIISGLVSTTQTNECFLQPCKNYGTCVDLPGRFECNCRTGYTGLTCETEINECSSQPCQNSGTCVDMIGQYKCNCTKGYTGLTCESEINECSSQPCQNSGTCEDMIGQYICNCTEGFTGLTCETEINECSSQPCQNSGTCVDVKGKYICNCTEGYTGLTCETEINECLSEPCQNSGTCVDMIGKYKCNCIEGYSGLTCETEIDECSSQPCQNSGTCVDVIGQYICNCTEGYTENNKPLCEKLRRKSFVTENLIELAMKNLSEYSSENVSRKANILLGINPHKLEPQDVYQSSRILENLASVRSKDYGNLISIVDNILEANTSVIVDSQMLWDSSARILNSLSSYAANLDIEPSPNITQITANLVSVISDTSHLPFGFGTNHINPITFYWTPEQLNVKNIIGAIMLSGEVFQRIRDFGSEDTSRTDENGTRLSFFIFHKVDLFVSPSDGSDENEMVPKSMVVAAAVHNVDTSNLLEPVEVILKPFRSRLEEEKLQCASWDLENVKGRWSTKGCHLNRTENDRMVCHCNHLGYFSIIGNADAVKPPEEKSMGVVGTSGIIISFIGLSLTIITSLVFKEFRRSYGQQVLFNMAIALLAANMVLFTGINATKPVFICKLVSALLQYLLLAAFSWTLVEGVLQYWNLTRNSLIPHFIFKACLIAWVLPAAPVITVFNIDQGNQIREHSCWLKESAFYYAFLLPVGLVILVNLMLFILVIKGITCDRSNIQSSVKKTKLTKLQVYAGFTCVILMGLTMVFGFLAISRTNTVYQYLFSVCDAFLGIFIFQLSFVHERASRQSRKLFQQ